MMRKFSLVLFVVLVFIVGCHSKAISPNSDSGLQVFKSYDGLQLHHYQWHPSYGSSIRERGQFPLPGQSNLNLNKVSMGMTVKELYGSLGDPDSSWDVLLPPEEWYSWKVYSEESKLWTNTRISPTESYWMTVVSKKLGRFLRPSSSLPHLHFIRYFPKLKTIGARFHQYNQYPSLIFYFLLVKIPDREEPATILSEIYNLRHEVLKFGMTSLRETKFKEKIDGHGKLLEPNPR